MYYVKLSRGSVDRLLHNLSAELLCCGAVADTLRATITQVPSAKPFSRVWSCAALLPSRARFEGAARHPLSCARPFPTWDTEHTPLLRKLVGFVTALA